MRDGVDRIERSVDAADLPAEPDYRVTSPVRLDVEVRKKGQTVAVAGRLAASLDLACSRCLEPFSVEAAPEFDLLYLPVTEAAGGGAEVAVADEDVSTAYYRDGVIDLGEMIHEQMYLTLPMKPLCRPDCRGLCPNCGANWNTGSCSCAPEWEDPRLAGLRALLKNDDHA